MVRRGSWIRLAGGSPVPVGTGAPGSRSRFVVERRRAKRGVESLFGGSKCTGCDAEMAVEGCTGWRYVVEEVAAAGGTAHLADPVETAGLRGPKKRAKTDRADAGLLRTLLLEGRLPES